MIGKPLGRGVDLGVVCMNDDEEWWQRLHGCAVILCCRRILKDYCRLCSTASKKKASAPHIFLPSRGTLKYSMVAVPSPIYRLSCIPRPTLLRLNPNILAIVPPCHPSPILLHSHVRLTQDLQRHCAQGSFVAGDGGVFEDSFACFAQDGFNF